MKLSGVVVRDDDKKLKASLESLGFCNCSWDSINEQLEKSWRSELLNLNADIVDQIHEEDLAWLVCRGKFPCEVWIDMVSKDGRMLKMNVRVVMENGKIVKERELPCVNVVFLKS